MSLWVPYVFWIFVVLMMVYLCREGVRVLRFFSQLSEVLQTWHTYTDCIAMGLDRGLLKHWLPKLYKDGLIQCSLNDHARTCADCQRRMRLYIYRHSNRALPGVSQSVLEQATDEQVLQLFELTMFGADTMLLFQFRGVPQPPPPRRKKRVWKINLPEWFPQPLPA